MPDTRATKNAESMTNAQGEFNPHKGTSEPLTTSGHQPGLKTSPADHAPEFSATTAPPGTAPPQNTHIPNPTGDTSIPGQANNPNLPPSAGTSALDSLPGATSADVHTGLGHPGQGQTSNELRHDGKHTASRERAGLEGVGGRGDKGVEVELRRLQEDRPMGEHGVKTAREHNTTLPGAERVENVTDQELAGSRA